MIRPFALGAVLALAACQSMYSAPAARLPPPQRLPAPVVQVEKPKPVEYRDKCDYDFRVPIKKVARDSKAAVAATKLGDTKVTAAEKTETVSTKGDLFRDGIDQYHQALRRDPYDAEVTLKLAVLYDQLRRKGCALALLGRISALATNKDFAEVARRQADAVNDHTEWFKDYRSEALAKLP